MAIPRLLPVSNTLDSTAFNYRKVRYLPMLVALLAPVSILLSLPPLFGNWIGETTDVSYNEEVKIFFSDWFTNEKAKPIGITIMIIIAALNLLLTNIALLSRFLERRVVLNTWIAIVGYSVHGVIMLSTIIYFVCYTDFGSEQHFTGDFIIGTVDCALSLISAILLLIDFYTSDRLKKRGSGLSMKQRELVLFAIFTTLWSTVGALIFSYYEQWSFVRGIYFTLVTMTTIGFGDYRPEGTGMRIVLFFYAPIGIVSAGLLINAIRKVILEKFQEMYIENLELRNNRLKAFATRNLSTDPENTLKPTLFSHLKAYMKKHFGKLPSTETFPRTSTQATNSVSEDAIEHNRLCKEKSRQLGRQLQFAILYLLIFWFLGAVIFMFTEEWSYFDAVYFCFVTFTTIGYGDLTITTFGGTVFFIGYALLGLVAAAYLISVATELWTNALHHRQHRVKLKRIIKAVNENTTDLDPQQLELDAGTTHHLEHLIEFLEKTRDSSTNNQVCKPRAFIDVTKVYQYHIRLIIERLRQNNSGCNGQQGENDWDLLEELEKKFSDYITMCGNNLGDTSSTTRVVSPIRFRPFRRSYRDRLRLNRVRSINRNTATSYAFTTM